LENIRNIILIGAGNVATNLGYAFRDAGLNILQVYSRNPAAAEALATALNAAFTHRLTEVMEGADLYILAVADDAIAEVVSGLRASGKFMVHTSGSVPMEVFHHFTGNYGVIYPVQTFSKDRKLDFRTIPVCLEASSSRHLEILNRLVSLISGDVRTVPSEQRRLLHLAAVFACNFPNFMYATAGKIVHIARLDFDILKPLILETALKVQKIEPDKAQTGPALRGDRKVMKAHLQVLRDDPEIKDLYRRISRAIEAMEVSKS
jgi:predicted short-subunit dehydrogenase-like oxidoreductase (DUF2520 family)